MGPTLTTRIPSLLKTDTGWSFNGQSFGSLWEAKAARRRYRIKQWEDEAHIVKSKFRERRWISLKVESERLDAKAERDREDSEPGPMG